VVGVSSSEIWFVSATGVVTSTPGHSHVSYAVGAGLQLREANRTHTPHYDEPDETAQRKIDAQRDMVRLGLEGHGLTHARFFAR
jgi:hypothetical protein